MQPVTTSPKEPSLPIYLTLPTTLVTTLASVSSMRPLVNMLTYWPAHFYAPDFFA